MSAIPGDLDTEHQPPMTVPLRHFLVGLGFLLCGAVLGTGVVRTAVGGLGRLAHLHLLLVGWVCVTIMGAMTQFVPVWSGTPLHSRLLASIQLVFVTAGLSGFALALLVPALDWLALFGGLVLLGLWTFAYNIGRTLATLGSYDVTERHFAFALVFFVLLSTLGVLLAVDLSAALSVTLPVSHSNLLGAHATLAVFGAVLTTVYGALYQLGPMFTQTDLHGIDRRLQSFEELGHPAGVLLLATGRLTEIPAVARVGGLLVAVAAVAVGLVLARRLSEMRVGRTPMHSRYAVVACSLVLWGVLAVPAWATRPLARAHLLGAAGTTYLLVLGVLGFVVLGTLYHIVPFIVWVHRYSDRLGFEPVPMVDDLYSDRLAAIDFTAILGGSVLLAIDGWLGVPGVAVAGLLLPLGVLAFVANVLLVVHEHSPHSFAEVLLGLHPRSDSDTARP